MPYWDWLQNLKGYFDYADAANYTAGALGSSDFFKALLSDFDQMINGSQRKFVLYSAHDGSLATFMAGMSYDTNFALIPFAATIVYELWQDNGQYYVKIKYNDDPAPIPA